MKKKLSGIYVIECHQVNKVYVGCSVDVSNRLNRFKSRLKANRCEIQALQGDCGAFGIAAFTFKLVDTCLPSEFKQKEREVVHLYASQGWKLYNDVVILQSNSPAEYKECIDMLVRILSTGKRSIKAMKAQLGYILGGN